VLSRIDIQTLQHITAWAAAFVAVGGLAWKLWRWLAPRWPALWDNIRKRTLGYKLGLVSQVVNDIRKEVKPNGGSSLRDAVEDSRRISLDNRAALRAMADSTEDGHVDVQANGQWEWANAALCRWLRTGENRLLGWGWTNFIDEDERAEIRADWMQAIAERRDLRIMVTLISNDGDRVETAWTLRPLTFNADNSVRILRLLIRRPDLTLRRVAVAVDDHGDVKLASEIRP
jgi:PAS domain S-box-containing protein